MHTDGQKLDMVDMVIDYVNRDMKGYISAHKHQMNSLRQKTGQ